MGWRRSDGVMPLLDPQSFEVVVESPRFAMDAGVAKELDAEWPPEPGECGVTPGRFPIRAVVLMGVPPDLLDDASSARRLASYAALLDCAYESAGVADVEAVALLDGRVETVRALGTEPSEILDIFRRLGD
jgi:hypothetical protein